MKITGISLSGVVFLFLLVTNVMAYDVSGTITTNSVWTRADSPYLVTNNIVVEEGILLAIQDGVTVRFANGTGFTVEGTLVARGNESSPITFTSNQTNPREGDWTCVLFDSPSAGASFDEHGRYLAGSILEYCDILYSGGQGSSGAITCVKSGPYLNNVTVDHSASNGIGIIDSEVRIEGCIVRNSSNNGILINNVQKGGLVQVKNCSLTQNRQGGINASFLFGSGIGIFTHNTFSNNGGSRGSCG